MRLNRGGSGQWRRGALVLAVLALIAQGSIGAVASLPPGGTFTDDDGNYHEPSIEAIAAAGITNGCDPLDSALFCPDDSVTRGQMAAFINRTLHLPPSAVDAFADDDGSFFEDDINRLAAAGITNGCDTDDPTLFCPTDFVSRAQMASFLVRAYDFTDGAGDDRFIDDDGSPFEPDIDRLAAAGVTLGCNPPDGDRFCPEDFVRRDEMATFLLRAEGLDPIVPPTECPILPDDNIWNRRVDDLPVHARSNDYIAAIGSSATLHADFGAGEWPPGSDAPIGIPYIEVDGSQPPVPIIYTAYGDESDPGPFPIPLNAPIEGGPSATGDRHVIAVDRANCILYELFDASPEGSVWEASSGARYDLLSNDLRPDGWTSADAAGLPVFPGLVRYDEVASGTITHAIRFTAPDTGKAHVWPARHDASSLTGLNYPPMGQRFRLKASFDISGYSADVQVILQAFKVYGLILADNGSPWYISGAPDERWNNDVLHEWDDIPGSAFEAVDVSSLIVHPDSGQASG